MLQGRLKLMVGREESRWAEDRDGIREERVPGWSARNTARPRKIFAQCVERVEGRSFQQQGHEKDQCGKEQRQEWNPPEPAPRARASVIRGVRVVACDRGRHGAGAAKAQRGRPPEATCVGQNAAAAPENTRSLNRKSRWWPGTFRARPLLLPNLHRLAQGGFVAGRRFPACAARPRHLWGTPRDDTGRTDTRSPRIDAAPWADGWRQVLRR